MKNKNAKKSKEGNQANESLPGYQSSAQDKQIVFFSSFEEAKEHGRKEMVSHTPEERLNNLEILRKRFFKEYLLPNGKWPSLSRTITIVKGTFE